MDKTTLEVYQHYGLEQDKKDVESGKLAGVDFLIGREEDIAKLTRNMAGNLDELSQIIICSKIEALYERQMIDEERKDGPRKAG
ncbi:hypothetical protein I6E91_24210 [Enterocloster clostridioformis]|uniref:hypothetical protein n=1 Tax=Enterocloster clostridioformis TaxID=1531 RepID=UPI001F4591A0|nr:hypothetical protein [Enterocloster clostridioformis]MCF2705095.1 hypothetical protein [Enterocloster clostridioformis]